MFTESLPENLENSVHANILSNIIEMLQYKS